MPVNSFENYPMSWRPKINKSKSPLYKTIAQALEKDIRMGMLRPNDKLPPQRELADYLDINVSTITRAFKICQADGLITGSVGKGTYVCGDILANAPMLYDTSLDSSYIDLGASHPIYEQNRYVMEMVKKLPAKINLENILSYYDITGTYGQKESAVLWLNSMGVPAKIEDILITSGLQNSLYILLSSLFSSGDKIATNSVIYPGFKNIANKLGIRLFPIPYIDQRIDLEYLEKVCKTENIKGIYLTPDTQNPTTITMNNKERRSISAIIKKHNLLCMEEGTYTFLSHDKKPSLYSYIPENTIHICTVSNALSAGLRIAYVVSPQRYQEEIVTGVRNINVMSSPLDSEIVSQLIRTGVATKMVNEKREEIEKRNQVVNVILQNYEVWGDLHSQFRWLVLPPSVTSQEIEDTLLAKQVKVFGSDRFVVANANCQPALRLAITSPKTITELGEGLKIIDSVLQQTR